MGSFTRKTIAMVLSLAMMITLFAGLGFMEVNAVGGTVVPVGTTVYDFTKLTTKTLAEGTEGFEGFSGTVSAAASDSKSYVQITKTSTDALTFVVDSVWSATFSSLHSNNAKGFMITAPDGKMYGRKSAEDGLTLSNMPAGTYKITAVTVPTKMDDGTGTIVDVSANHAYLSTAVFTVESNEPPADVTNLTASIGDSQVDLDWEASSLASVYYIFVDGSSVPIETTSTNYTIGELTNDVEHTFMVKAVNSAGSSAGVTVTATPKEPTEPPGTFTLTATAGNQRVNLSWTAAQYAVSYDVYRDGTAIATGLTDKTYQDTRLTNGTAYKYVVKASNKNGSTDSNELQVSPVEPLPSDIKIIEQAGWLESAVVKWTNTAEVDKYNVYTKKAGDTDYIKVDDELVRYYGSYYRVDAVGLEAGQYTIKIASVMDGSETGAVETEVINVLAHNRDGYAHDPASPNKTASGGYKDNGTPGDDAIILYIDKDTINTVELDVVTNSKGGTTHEVGLANIMAGREKGYDKTPLIIRFIGMINSTDVSGLNGDRYIQVKGCYNVTVEGIGDDTMLNGWSFLIRMANNIEVRNFGVKGFNDDGISLDTANTNIWVHNNDIFYGQNKGGDQEKGDGSVDVKGKSTYVTVSYNHFFDSGKCSLCGMHQDSNTGEFFVTYHHNWFDHSDSRHPRIRVGTIHIYNNYFDGNAKYGVGITTGGSAFVENNYFRNCYHPVLSSRQGTDALGKGTFSGEDGGMVKMFNNTITGDRTVPVVDARTPIETGFDAYIAYSRDEKVPEQYVTVAGGTKYNNFDTAAAMYTYTPDDPENVPGNVTAFAGRTQGGDFIYTFDDSVADESYAIDTVLEAKLKEYTTSMAWNYIVSGKTYPATTDGPIPTSKPTIKPIETPKPTNTPGPTLDPTQPTPTATALPTAPPTAAPKTTYWKPAANITAGETIGIPGLSPVDNMTYTEKKQTIGGVAFTGKCVGLTAASPDGKTGASLKFTPESDGTFIVYYKVNAGKTFYIMDESGNTVASYTNASASREYKSTSGAVEAGKTYYGFVDGSKAEFFGAGFATSAPAPTDGPNPTAKPTNRPVPTVDPASFDYQIISTEYTNDGLSVNVQYNGSGSGEASMMAVSYSTDRIMTNVKTINISGTGTYTINGFTEPANETVKVLIWNNYNSIAPLSVAKTIEKSSSSPLPSLDPTDKPDPTTEPSVNPDPTAKPTVDPDATSAPTAAPTSSPYPMETQEGSHTWTFGVVPMEALGVKGNDGKHDTLTMSEGLVIYDNLYINPSKKAIVVDYSSKTIGTDKFTERLKLAGAGSVSDQHLAFTPGAAGKLSISFAHASSQGEPRFMAVNQNGTEILQEAAVGATQTMTVDIAAGAPVYIYSKESGLNVYKVEYMANN